MESKLAVSFDFQKPAYIGTRQYTFENDNGVVFCVQFVQKKSHFNEYIVDLSIKDVDMDEYLTTNFGDVFRVMSTVVQILIDFVNNTSHAHQIEFVPVNEENQGYNRRLIVFQRYAKIFKQHTQWDYKIDGNTFILTKPIQR
jgi:hypothetical protein